MTFSEILQYSTSKTRVVLYTSQFSIAKMVSHALDFSGKEYDFFLRNGENRVSNNDFVILETDDAQKAIDFGPNIILISEEISADHLPQISENITAGGVLIYPENKEILIEKAENYFRKLPFLPTEISKAGDNFILHTDMGNIPLISKEEDLLKNINGIQLLCQQFGVMEEDFYEPMMTFE